MNPCFTGCVTFAVAAACGAEPIPASLLKSPLLIPCIRAAPIPPPTACLKPNAFEVIVLITEGNSVIFIIITITAINTYPMAIIGTITLLTFAMLCIPPKMISAVKIVRTIPIVVGLKLNALLNAALNVLLCTELKAKPKVSIVNIANETDNHFIFRPISM